MLPLIFKNQTEMKKVFLAFIFLCGMASAIVGCKPELKNVRGTVKSLVVINDTLSSMTLSADGKDMQVDLTRSRLQNGLAIEGDSVIVDYIDGDNGTLIAVVCTTLPKSAHEFVPSDTLITKESKDSIQ